MSRGSQNFRQSDLTKAIKGAVNGGLKVERVEIDSAGKIVVFASQPTLAVARNEWDDVR
jgi:hypothetical protein